MELKTKDAMLETGTEMVEEDFEIGDMSIVMEILRSKMYSNPIRTIVQEIMSNARDAHREHGNPEAPILVKLPNALEPDFWIRDFGIGISPERMSNVFIKYGMSTKRGDNVQTGGFGLGAKSPWAYADNFIIETFLPDEDGKMMKRRYAAVLGKKRQGQLLQVDRAEPTDEPRGTKITVQVKDGDAPKFAQWVEDRARYWEPRPDVIGMKDFQWRDVTTLFEGDEWMIVDGGGHTGTALLDGIPYPVERQSILTPDENVHNGTEPCKLAFDMGFVIKMGVADAAVAATREGIDYDEDTLAEIRRRLEAMMGEVAVVVAKNIEDAADLWEANRIFKRLPDLPKAAVRGKATWNGIPVSGEFNMPKGGFATVLYERKHKHGMGVGTKATKSAYFSFPSDNERIFLLDEENLQRNRALYLFRTEEREDVERVRVIVVPTGQTPAHQKEIDEGYEKAEKEHGLRTLIESLEGFSTVTKWNPRKHGPKAKASNAGLRNVGGPVIRVKELDFRREWKESNVTLDDEEMVFVQLYGGKPYMEEGKQRETTRGFLESMQSKLDITVVGVQTPFMTKVPEDWVWLADAIEEKYEEVITDPDYAAAMSLDQMEHRMDQSIGSLEGEIAKGNLTVHDNSLLAQWKEESKRQRDLVGLQESILSWAGYARKQETVNRGTRLKVIKEAVLAAMPMLVPVDYRWYGGMMGGKAERKAMTEEVQWYIDAKDPERAVSNAPQAQVDKRAHDLYKGNGGTMTYAEIEAHLGLKQHNGMAALRAVKRHQKRIGLAVAS